MEKGNSLKIAAVHFFMYFFGPIIWGVWMIFRLKIVSLHEYLHCFVSIPVLVMLSLYYVVNTVFMSMSMKRFSNLQLDSATVSKEGILALKFNAFSVVSFGTIGTFVFLSMLSTNKLTFIPISTGDWYKTAIVGAMSGASLVLMFYNFLSTTIVTTTIKPLKSILPAAYLKTLVLLKREIKILYCVGIILFFVSAYASLLITDKLQSFYVLNDTNLLFMVSSLIPVLMSFIMFQKSIRNINRELDYSKDSIINRKKPTRKPIILVQYIVRGIALVLFFALFFTQNGRFWLIPLIVGFILSLLLGRVYCGWLCPVNTINAITSRLFKKSSTKETSVSAWLRSRAASIFFFSLFLISFVLSLFLKIRPQIFLTLTLTGIFASFAFSSYVWCGSLCPWGTMFRFLSKIAPLRLSINSDQCVKCGKCNRNCPAKSIEISENSSSINSSRCMQCLNCVKECNVNAIVMQSINSTTASGKND